ncbi:MAG: hypothetical protein FWD88_00650, partial [Treponema sp.]|nr:hypothetical protein [Treponema sp.]
MSGPCFFEQNMLALSRRNPELCARLKIARPEAAGTEAGSYRFLKTASGETVPALVDGSGIAR